MTNATPEPAGLTCHSCGRQVPEGEYCGVCGARLAEPTPRGVRRLQAYAANPHEHVFSLSVVTTLFPHLPHHRTAPFRVGVLVTVATLLGLGLLRLTGPGMAAAAVMVPLLYLLYLYEVEVYEDAPLRVVGATFLVGAVLGIPWALVTGPLITQQVVLSLTQGPAAGAIAAGAVLPLAAQALMLLGPLLLLFRNRYDEALDGFTFAAASSLGFTFTSTLVNLLPELQEGLFINLPALTNALEIVQRGLLIPIINASTTGLLAAVLWLRLGRVRDEARRMTTAILPVALGAVLLRVALGEVTLFFGGTWIELAASGLGAMIMLLAVRIALHDMLLAEAVEVTIGAPVPCSHCGRVVPRMAFCPHCGIATRATPKSGAGAASRSFR